MHSFLSDKGCFPVYSHAMFWKGPLKIIIASFCSIQDHGISNTAFTPIFDTTCVTRFTSSNREKVRLQLQIIQRQQLWVPARSTSPPSTGICSYSQAAAISLGAACHRKLSREMVPDVLGRLPVFIFSVNSHPLYCGTYLTNFGWSLCWQSAPD